MNGAQLVLYAAAQDPWHPVLRIEHLLLGIVLFVAFWLISVAGVSLLCLFSFFAFVAVLRAWPEPVFAAQITRAALEHSQDRDTRAA